MESSKPHTPAWLNPRQALHITRLLEYLAWRGGTVRFDGHAYAFMREHRGLEPYQVDQAIDAAFVLRLVKMHVGGGDITTVTLMGIDLLAQAEQA